jgi:hypothetical protein
MARISIFKKLRHEDGAKWLPIKTAFKCPLNQLLTIIFEGQKKQAMSAACADMRTRNGHAIVDKQSPVSRSAQTKSGNIDLDFFKFWSMLSVPAKLSPPCGGRIIRQFLCKERPLQVAAVFYFSILNFQFRTADG